MDEGYAEFKRLRQTPGYAQLKAVEERRLRLEAEEAGFPMSTSPTLQACISSVTLIYPQALRLESEARAKFRAQIEEEKRRKATEKALEQAEQDAARASYRARVERAKEEAAQVADVQARQAQAALEVQEAAVKAEEEVITEAKARMAARQKGRRRSSVDLATLPQKLGQVKDAAAAEAQLLHAAPP